MATYRKRMLASCIWEDEKFCQLTRVEQVLFIGLITHADDDGRLRGDAEYLKTKIFPFDRVGVLKIRIMVEKFHEMRLIIFYPTTKGYVIAFPKWNKYQKIEAKYYQPTEFEDPSPKDLHTDIIPRSRQSKRIQSNETETESNGSTTKAALMIDGIKRNTLKEDSN